MATIKLIELFNRAISLVKEKDSEVYHNGEDNLYPNRVERIVNNSPTAKGARGVMAKYVAGFIEDAENIIVNKKKNYRLSDLIKLIAEDLSTQGGSYIWIGYGIEESGQIVPKQLDVLDYKKCRISKKDDDGNDGKIIYKDYESKKSFFGKKDSSKEFYPFNPNQDVLLAQMEGENLEEAVKSYKGQVFFLNPSNYIYPLAPIDGAIMDADTEYRISEYSNTQTRTGFLGKTIALTAGIDEEDEKAMQEDLMKFLGAENSASIYYMNFESGADLEKILKIHQLKPQFDDKLFEVTDKRLRKNILSVFNNVPEPLIYSSDSSLFGANGDALREFKTFYSEQTDYERSKIEESLKMIGFNCEIKPLINEEENAESTEIRRSQIEAQATLKGSVGGVTALIELQKSVSQGFTDRSSAIEIVTIIYGLSREEADKIIGQPINIEEQTLEGDDVQ